MDFNKIINSISNFFITLYQDYLWVIILFIVLLVFIIYFAMRSIFNRKKREKEDSAKANKQAIAELTTEEIENISKNVSNPDEFREMVENQSLTASETQEVVEEKPESPAPIVEVKEEPKKPTATKKPTAKKQAEEVTQEPTNKRVYIGKWKIKKDESGFFAKLHASNGGLLLITEHYTTMSGVKNGIETIKKNVENGNFAISIDKHNHYHFKLFSSSNKLICVSEDYSSKAKCDKGIQSVKRFATTATIIYEENDD